jgi:hypothetical protein
MFLESSCKHNLCENICLHFITYRFTENSNKLKVVTNEK